MWKTQAIEVGELEPKKVTKQFVMIHEQEDRLELLADSSEMVLDFRR